MRIGAVLLAAGLGTRFGGDKLLADAGGRPMASLAMDRLCAMQCSRTAAVVSDERVALLARERGIEVIINPAPQEGMSGSIVLGVRTMADMDAVLLAVADQPKLSAASLAALIDRFCASEKGIACLRDDTHAGNPAVFSKEYYDELLTLTGDRGAKTLLKRHSEDVLEVACLSDGELADADTPQALARMMVHAGDN